VAPAVGGREDDDGAALEDEKAFGAAVRPFLRRPTLLRAVVRG